MSVNLQLYSRIRNNVLVGYFGFSPEYLLQLRDVRPSIESALPGLQVYIGCRDEDAHLLAGQPRVIKASDVEARKLEFGKAHEIVCDGLSHPIEKLLKDSAIPIQEPDRVKGVLHHFPPSNTVGRCLIVPQGNYPTKSMTDEQVAAAKDVAYRNNHHVEFGDDVRNVSWVIGVENVQTWQAASLGRRVSLVPTGVGTDFYITTWDKVEVLEI